MQGEEMRAERVRIIALSRTEWLMTLSLNVTMV